MRAKISLTDDFQHQRKYNSRVTRVLYLDQNAWVALARGASDKASFPREHAALSKVIEGVQSQAIIAPLPLTNIYETAKINNPARRINMALTQAMISGGRVFRSRRRILEETLTSYLARYHNIQRPEPKAHWFLSDLWFESAADYSPQIYGEISEPVIDLLRQDPANALFDYLTASEEDVRLKMVRRYSEISAELVTRIEAARVIAAGETIAFRKRAYGARLIIDEIDFILATGKELGMGWETISDIGSSLARRIAVDIPVLNIERELAARLEDQTRAITENDLRDMAAFTIVLPFADIVVAEKQFVNLARQARLDKNYNLALKTSVFDL